MKHVFIQYQQLSYQKYSYNAHWYIIYRLEFILKDEENDTLLQ